MGTTFNERFQQAVQTLKRGDQKGARHMMRQLLIENPKYAPAWLWMSALVDDTKQQRECLQRTLELDPTNDSARRGLEVLELQEFVDSIPASEDSEEYAVPISSTRQARKLGEYLRDHGLITEEQLKQALNEQRSLQDERQWTRVTFGDALLKLNLLSPYKLASALVGQQKEREVLSSDKPPEFLGEYLLYKGIIEEKQLSEVLAVQMQLRQKGKNMLIGELLTRAGYVTPSILQDMLKQQLDDIFERFDEELEEEEE